MKCTSHIINYAPFEIIIVFTFQKVEGRPWQEDCWETLSDPGWASRRQSPKKVFAKQKSGLLNVCWKECDCHAAVCDATLHVLHPCHPSPPTPTWCVSEGQTAPGPDFSWPPMWQLSPPALHAEQKPLLRLQLVLWWGRTNLELNMEETINDLH